MLELEVTCFLPLIKAPHHPAEPAERPPLPPAAEVQPRSACCACASRVLPRLLAVTAAVVAVAVVVVAVAVVAAAVSPGEGGALLRSLPWLGKMARQYECATSRHPSRCANPSPSPSPGPDPDPDPDPDH